ncbi:hypothetical protein Zm00014a_014934 [Zea mays]|uniref:Uncharacterized protein n=1 Tax=Zea mays TaxID=4577 RepID=A0A3L6DKX2_MAIZE|nr:hypothetical protein Zm00014a_014934 [Zea mays]
MGGRSFPPMPQRTPSHVALGADRRRQEFSIGDLRRHIQKVLLAEDKLRNLGCKVIGKKIVEVEMDLTKAKSKGYLWGNNTAAVNSDKKQ